MVKLNIMVILGAEIVVETFSNNIFKALLLGLILKRQDRHFHRTFVFQDPLSSADLWPASWCQGLTRKEKNKGEDDRDGPCKSVFAEKQYPCPPL